ncbi:hypothetical protein AB0E81_27320 [Streptomyces sp. NPDC033538]|uniref:hypothetical protein n=1 Tax=Streptomyces sp. NPDC033538 TaxID=3155367 RepID=UPI003407CBDD
MFALRRLAGRARRCTAGDPDGALVRGCRGRGGAGGTGVTRTPRPLWAGVLAGAPDEAGPAELARWTGVARARGAEVAAGAVRVPVAGAVGAGDEAAPGIARSGATGMRCTAGAPDGDADDSDCAGRADPAAGRADASDVPDASIAPDSMLLPAAGSSTAGDGAPVNDGFCHVGSRPPNPASATPVRAVPVARWIGGRLVQAATATGGAGSVVRVVLPPASEPDASAEVSAETSAGGVS